jgi:hypothetical protein
MEKEPTEKEYLGSLTEGDFIKAEDFNPTK